MERKERGEVAIEQNIGVLVLLPERANDWRAKFISRSMPDIGKITPISTQSLQTKRSSPPFKIVKHLLSMYSGIKPPIPSPPHP